MDASALGARHDAMESVEKSRMNVVPDPTQYRLNFPLDGADLNSWYHPQWIFVCMAGRGFQGVIVFSLSPAEVLCHL